MVPLDAISFGRLTATKKRQLCYQGCLIYEHGSWTLGERYRPDLGGAIASQSPDGQLWIFGGGSNQDLQLYEVTLLITTLGYSKI